MSERVSHRFFFGFPLDSAPDNGLDSNSDGTAAQGAAYAKTGARIARAPDLGTRPMRLRHYRLTVLKPLEPL
jgi:hypothetical protein